VLLWSVVT